MNLTKEEQEILHHYHNSGIGKTLTKQTAEKQRRQLLNQPTCYVLCPCGDDTPLEKAYRCAYCGVFFCLECTERHFKTNSPPWFYS